MQSETINTEWAERGEYWIKKSDAIRLKKAKRHIAHTRTTKAFGCRACRAHPMAQTTSFRKHLKSPIC